MFMVYKIALNFEDGISRFIDCNEGELVSDAAYRQSINIPLDCRDGACGTCMCFAESGSYELDGYIEDALSDTERTEGNVLTCCMKVSSDCVLSVPATSKSCKTGTNTVTASINTIDIISQTTARFSVKSDDLKALSFLPGQYANITVPRGEEVRAYSFSSLLSEHNEVSFLIRILPHGKMSSYIANEAKVGDLLTLSGPMGSFYLRKIIRPLLLLAGGTGLAPLLAMLEVISIEGNQWPVHLIYGVTNDVDLVEMEKLEKFVQVIPSFTFTACVANPASTHKSKGFVTGYIDDTHVNNGNVDVYLCGPPPMVDAVKTFMSEKCIETSSFRYEKFS